MMRINLRMLVLAWIAAALVAIPLRLYRADARPTELYPPAERVADMSVAHPDSIDQMVSAAVEANIFGVQDEDVSLRPPDVGPNAGVVSQLPPRRLRLSAIVGPPWRAVIETEGAQSAPFVVEAGDTVQTRRVTRITADSIILMKGREVFRYVVTQSWMP